MFLHRIIITHRAERHCLYGKYLHNEKSLDPVYTREKWNRSKTIPDMRCVYMRTETPDHKILVVMRMMRQRAEMTQNGEKRRSVEYKQKHKKSMPLIRVLLPSLFVSTLLRIFTLENTA